MSAVLLGLQGLTLVLVCHALLRLRAAQQTFNRRSRMLEQFAVRVEGLERTLTPQIREIVAQARRAAGESIPVVSFPEYDAQVPAVFSTDNVLVLGQTIGAKITTMCQGEGICGLCRVRVTDGKQHLDPPSENEELLLRGYGSGDPDQRLACHLRPRGDIEVRLPDS